MSWPPVCRILPAGCMRVISHKKNPLKRGAEGVNVTSLVHFQAAVHENHFVVG